MHKTFICDRIIPCEEISRKNRVSALALLKMKSDTHLYLFFLIETSMYVIVLI